MLWVPKVPLFEMLRGCCFGVGEQFAKDRKDQRLRCRYFVSEWLVWEGSAGGAADWGREREGVIILRLFLLRFQEFSQCAFKSIQLGLSTPLRKGRQMNGLRPTHRPRKMMALRTYECNLMFGDLFAHKSASESA